MKEDDWIAAIRKWTAARPAAALVAGIGDDCAILRPRRGEDLLITTDFLIEGVHFRRPRSSSYLAGWRALARGLSDIAAMGGRARFALLSLALPPWAGRAWVRGFYQGLQDLGRQFGVRIIGGDLTRAATLAADIVAVGAVPSGRALRRAGARPGDLIFVSGPLGRAAAAGYRDLPVPRLALAAKLLGKATACIDLSDGLAIDLHRLCRDSGVAAALDGILPSAPGATLDQALGGGEDYELLCTLPPHRKPPQGLVRVGVIVPGPAGKMTFGRIRLRPAGWDPLR